MNKRSNIDRRTDSDRRIGYDLTFTGPEHRRNERRITGETRTGWARIGKWESACLGVIAAPLKFN